MNRLFIPLLFPAFLGCSVTRALDFGGSDEKPFEFRFAWQKRFETSKAEPGKVDAEGVYQPETPEVDAALQFPDIHAGLNAEVRPEFKLTPTVGVEVVEFKVPYLRWFNVQVQGGNQLVDVYLGKRLISVFEVTIGPWYGYDFEEHDTCWGVGGTLIRF